MLAVPVPPEACSFGLAHLTEKGDWLLAHSMGIPNVGSDDLSEWFFDTLQREGGRWLLKDSQGLHS